MSAYLTVPEVAARLRCGEWKAARLLRSGEIPAAKVAGRWLATPDDLDAYVASQGNRVQSVARRRRRRT